MVVHCASNRAKAEKTRKLIEENDGKAAVVTGDLTDPCTAERLMAENGPLDALVLDASLQIRRPWQKISLEKYQKQMTCNFYSSLRLIQLAVPHMKAQKWGRIVTIGSVQERKPIPICWCTWPPRRHRPTWRSRWPSSWRRTGSR